MAVSTSLVAAVLSSGADNSRRGYTAAFAGVDARIREPESHDCT